MRIEDLRPDAEAAIEQVARMLFEEFRAHSPGWLATLGAALDEVRESFEAERLSRVAMEDDGAVVGWNGGIREYNGHAWELHPLVVRGDRQSEGIGRALVEDLERLVAERGAITLYLGTDDEDGRTSLAGMELLPTRSREARIRNLDRHPFEFYPRLGFSVVGVLPDVNGLGKPDILMAKRVFEGNRRLAERVGAREPAELAHAGVVSGVAVGVAEVAAALAAAAKRLAGVGVGDWAKAGALGGLDRVGGLERGRAVLAVPIAAVGENSALTHAF